MVLLYLDKSIFIQNHYQHNLFYPCLYIILRNSETVIILVIQNNSFRIPLKCINEVHQQIQTKTTVIHKNLRWHCILIHSLFNKTLKKLLIFITSVFLCSLGIWLHPSYHMLLKIVRNIIKILLVFCSGRYLSDCMCVYRVNCISKVPISILSYKCKICFIMFLCDIKKNLSMLISFW